jgi:hypothetical protein
MKNLTQGQAAVLRAFAEFGRPMDDVSLSILVHHIEDEPMSSSGIRSRRAELSRSTDDRPALVRIVGTKRLKSGRNAAIHDLTPAGRRAAAKLPSVV